LIDDSKNKLANFNWLLIIGWTILGLILRSFNLDTKPASSIEIATIGYSLGHGFNAIALNRIVSWEILSSLHLDTSIGYGEIFNRLRQESTHPPLYFWLTRCWIGWWLDDGDLVSLQVARSLSTIFGTLAIPAMFGLGKLAFRSRLVAHFAAIAMAISPYGIYLAQEARHYTLTILWVIASVACLIKTLQLIQQKISVPPWLSLIWIVVNALGIATHYFFALALGAEAIAVVFFWLFNRSAVGDYLRGLYLAAIGTIVSCVVWLPIVRGISSNEMTTWIQTSYQAKEILLPIPRLLAWIITMVMLLPVEGVPKLVAIFSGIAILIVLIWTIPILIRQWRSLWFNFNTRSPMIILSGYLWGCLVILLSLIYGMGKDVSLAARYHFIYFPIIILLVAVALAACFRGDSILNNTSINTIVTAGKRIVVVWLILGFLGSLSVINNFGFQKSRQSDRLAAYIQNNSMFPTIVAMTHKTHSELREMVGLAFSFKRLNLEPQSLLSGYPQFLLIQNGRNAASNLDKIIAQQPKPLALFGINLEMSEENLQQLGCNRDKTIDLKESGYRDLFYLCQ
jgi:uncharacterized membrane protein